MLYKNTQLDTYGITLVVVTLMTMASMADYLKKYTMSGMKKLHRNYLETFFV